MRTLIWGKTFSRAFKRVNKRRPDLIKDIGNTLRLLVIQCGKIHKIYAKLADNPQIDKDLQSNGFVPFPTLRSHPGRDCDCGGE